MYKMRSLLLRSILRQFHLVLSQKLVFYHLSNNEYLLSTYYVLENVLSHRLFLITAFLRYISHVIQFPNLNCILQWFLKVCSQNCVTITTVNFRIFSPLQKIPYPLVVNTHPPLPCHTVSRQPQAVNMFSVSMDLSLLYISHKQNHAIYGPLWLASFTQHDIFKAYPCCHECTLFLFIIE